MKKRPSAAGIGLIVLCVLGIVASTIWIFWRDSRSPETVTTALRGEKKDYVGKWSTKDTTLRADLDIDATGEISYNESSALRASRGQQGNYEADFLQITAFEGDNIVVGRSGSLRIKVTSRPHVVGDHFEMTANDLSFVRQR
jgi:hypothetical protein